jgi:predicted NAD/FAD-dependent oxidoreductase
VQKQVLIVGAGLSGLMAAQSLRQAGIAATVVDKGSRPGGRMATRPFEGAIFDYGAQFFTVRSERFAGLVRAWEAKGLVRVWCRGFAEEQDGHPRYIAPMGMNSIAAQLAQGVEVRCGVKVSRIFAAGNRWTLETDFDEVLLADALIVTTPVPQTLALLNGAVGAAEAEVLSKIEYERCLALMAILEEPADLPEPGARQIVNGEPVSWIADNRRKGVSPFSNSITIHAGAQYSLANWEKPAEEVAAELLGNWRATAWKLHRWKFAKPVVLHPDRCFELAGGPPLLLAGDAFGEPRIEGAALSGLAAAERLRERLSRL